MKEIEDLPYFPHLLDWLGNSFTFHCNSLLICLVVATAHCHYSCDRLLPAGDTVMTGFLVGFCTWIVWIAISEGYGLG